MKRSLPLGLALVALAPAMARADDRCDELGATVDTSREPAMAAPKERAAVEALRDGGKHHQAGLKLAAVVASRADAEVEFAAAVASYQRAAALSPAPLVLFNLAQLYRQTGQYEQAIRTYDAFLQQGQPQAPMRRFAECLRALAMTEAYRSYTAARLPTTMVEPAAVEPPAPAPAPAPEAVADPPSAPDLTRPAPGWSADRLSWGLTGGGLVVAGLGGYLLTDARSLERDANATTNEAARRDLRDDATARRTFGTVAAVAGAALVVGGVVRLARTPRARKEKRTALYLTARGVGVVGRF